MKERAAVQGLSACVRSQYVSSLPDVNDHVSVPVCVLHQPCRFFLIDEYSQAFELCRELVEAKVHTSGK